jgi:hypothetical protein
MQRRSLLALGAISAAVLALGGGALALLQPGLRDARLSEEGREVFAAISRGLLDGSLPAGNAPSRTAIEALLTRIDGVIGALAPHAQSELSQLLALLASSGGRRALAGVSVSWTQASTAEVQAGLQAMRVSTIELRRQAYQALHDIVGGAYFSDRQTWGLLGYPGPRNIEVRP